MSIREDIKILVRNYKNKTIAIKNKMSRYMQQLEWISRELYWVKRKPIPRGYIMVDFIYSTWNDIILEMGNRLMGTWVTDEREAMWSGCGNKPEAFVLIE